MPSSSTERLVDYMVVKGWIFVLIVILLILMYFFGIFDVLSESSSKCSLGDGFSCKSSFFTNDSSYFSDGDINDYILLSIRNTLGEDITAFSVESKNCKAVNQVSIKNNETISYVLNGCEKMKGRSHFTEYLILKYTTGNNDVSVQHLQYGYARGLVEAPMPEQPIDILKEKIKDWMRVNVGTR
jgi:hypothetical protein